MEETVKGEVVSDGLCPDCRTEIRADAEFCYHCGSRIRHAETNDPQVTVSNEVIANGFHTKGPGAMVDGKTRSQTRTRRARTPISKEPVQVVWRPVDGPGLTFVFLSIFAAVLAALMIAMAYYLK